MNSPLAQIAHCLRVARVDLANDNKLAGEAEVILVNDEDGERHCVADYFMRLRNDENETEAAKRIALAVLGGSNRHNITRVAVIPKARDVSRVVDLDDPFNVCFSAEFTNREGLWMFEPYGNQCDDNYTSRFTHERFTKSIW